MIDRISEEMAEEAEATSVSPNARKYILDRSTFYYQALTTQAKSMPISGRMIWSSLAMLMMLIEDSFIE